MVLELDAPTDVEKRFVTETARDLYLGMSMLCSMSCPQFGELMSGLKNEYVKGNNN